MQRYLNIRLPGSVITEVNITGITRLGGVQDAIKLKLGDAINSAAAFIGIFDVNNNRISTWTEFDSLPNDYFEEGGCCLTVHCAQNQPKFTPVVSLRLQGVLTEPKKRTIETENGTSTSKRLSSSAASGGVSWSVEQLADSDVLKQCTDLVHHIDSIVSIVKRCQEDDVNLESKASISYLNGKPNVLLSNLNCTLDSDAVERVTSALSLVSLVTIYGTSGSGKTRVALESCTNKVGIYLVAGQEQVTPLGSSDLQVMCDELSDKLIVGAFSDNTRYVERYYFCVLAARLFVMDRLWPNFLLIQPFQWLLLQLLPVQFFGQDVFAALSRIFQKMSQSELEGYITFQLQKFANSHPSTSKRLTLPVFLDEAQIMLTKHMDMFLSSNTLDTRPLYIAVTRAHRKVFSQSFTHFPLAVLGTELSLDLAKEAITSSVLKQKYMDIIISNCYDSPEAVQKYLEPTIGILPRKYAALLVGRPRLASSLIESHFLDPSQSMSALVMKLFNQEANEMSTRFSELYSMFPSSKASIDGVLSFLDDSLGNYLLGKGPVVIETSLKFESGIGRLKSDKNGIRVVELSEPFVIAGFMRTSRERTLESSIICRLRCLKFSPTQQGFEFESLVALKVVETLKHPQPVENCAFLTDSLKKKFAGKLIKLRMPFVEGHPSFIQALNSTTSSLVQFLTSPSAPIAAPDMRTGPDLVAVLEILSSTLFLEDNILLLIQCKYVKDAVDLDRDILRTTTFSRLFTAKNGETYLSRSAEFINLKAALPLLNIKYTCGAGVIFPAQFSAQKLSLLRNHASNSNVVLFAASDEEKLLEPNLFDDSEVLLLNELKAK